MLIAESLNWQQVTNVTAQFPPDVPSNIVEYRVLGNSYPDGFEITTTGTNKFAQLAFRLYNIGTGSTIAFFTIKLFVINIGNHITSSSSKIDKTQNVEITGVSSNISVGYDANHQTITIKFNNTSSGNFEYTVKFCTVGFLGCLSSFPLSAFIQFIMRPSPPRPINISNTPNSLLLSDQVQVPVISILSQTLIDGSDIGNTLFTIQDKITYYYHKSDNICGTFFIDENEIKTTIFDQCCPKIVSVLIDPPGNNPICGGEKTALDKISNIYIGRPFAITIQQFTLNIVTYSLSLIHI